MPKNKYSDDFENFWSVYPRKTAKFPAFKAWGNAGIEGDAFLPRQIIGDIEKRTRLKFWPKDHTKIPHAATWINQRRWEDEGWEAEVESREPKRGEFKPSQREYKPIDTGPDMSLWECLVNRMLLNYIRAACGLRPEQLKQALRTKRDVLAELAAAADEEVAADPEKRGEMLVMIADTLLLRLDMDCGLALRHRVLIGDGE